LARKLPRLAFFLVLFTLSSIGLPGLNGFAGEFLILAGMFQRGWSQTPAGLNWELLFIAVLAVLGVVLGAWYMLWLVQRLLFGPLREPQSHAADAKGHEPASHAHHAPAIRDLNFREMAALLPLAVFVFWIGLAPATFLQPIAPSVEQMAGPIDAEFQKHFAASAVRAWAPLAPPLHVAGMTIRPETVAEPVAHSRSLPIRRVSEGGPAEAP
jgi:NADH-quinone oxidoreductase subunit M